MSKNKSIFVTLVMAVMLALILVGAYRIEEKAFFGILAALDGYGFLRGAGDLCRWMQAEPKPIETVEAEQVDPDDPFAYDDEFAGSAPFIFGGLRFHDGTFEEAEMMKDYISLDDAREAMWRVLNGMGYLREMNERLVEEVDAVLDDYPVIHVRRANDG